MIDFRYHIVSLISMFLALAVGIALGAGPLGGTIGDRLTEQVAQLRTEKDELRIQLDAESARTAERGRYIEASAQELLAGTLPNDVAVVTLPDVEDEVVAEVIARLEQAGATVTTRLALTPAWTDPDQQSFRSSIVGNVAGYLDPPPEPDASSDAVLGHALAEALTAADPDDPATVSGSAALILEVLSSGQLVSVTTPPSMPAEAVVVVASSGGQASPEAVRSLVTLVDAFAADSEGTVVGGAADTDEHLVAAVRSGESAERVATVDNVRDLTGQVILPRALARALAGEIGHYGFGASADEAFPAPPAGAS